MKTRKAPGSLALLFTLSIAAGCGGGSESIPSDAGADGGPVVILDGGGTIPTPPDGPSLCPGTGACNYQTNAGCTATQTCVPVPDQSGGVPPTCVNAGQGTSGAVCQTFEQCAPGYLCAGGQCYKTCCGGDWSGCPSAAEHCIQKLSLKNNDGLTVATGAMLCVPVNTCDALDPASCPVAGQTCQIVDPTGATLCLPEGSGDSGEACPCKGGFLCVDKECRRLCKAVEGGGEPLCEDGEGVCIHYQRDPQGVGECTPEGSGN